MGYSGLIVTKCTRERCVGCDENGESFEKQFSISITDQNDAPTGLSLSSSNIEEGLPINTVVGILSTDGPL